MSSCRTSTFSGKTYKKYVGFEKVASNATEYKNADGEILTIIPTENHYFCLLRAGSIEEYFMLSAGGILNRFGIEL